MHLHLALPKRTLCTLEFVEAHTSIYEKNNDDVTRTHANREIRNGGRSFFFSDIMDRATKMSQCTLWLMRKYLESFDL